MKSFIISLILFAFVSFSTLFAQDDVKDKGEFIEYHNEFLEKIMAETGVDDPDSGESEKEFKLDLSGYDLPTSISEFTTYWYNEPISQGYSGTCWVFSTISYFESEIYRLHKKKLKLSEMYTVYWETVEKAKRYIQEKGNSLFSEGSEANAVPKIWKLYGIVPESVYPGKKPGQMFHNHEEMFIEMNTYLENMKNTNTWNEKEGISKIKSILDKYMGTPPEEFTYEGKEYTPKEFLKDVTELNLDDYIDVLSYMQQPYYEKVEYEVPDNWWFSKDYHNIPLDEFMSILKNAIKNGYTVCIGGDVSEPGINPFYDVAVVPSFDIPSEFIDENARQFRFSNQTTQDDHGIHVVGYLDKDGEDWFLIKDSGSGSRNGKNKGYYFFHEDYVKLKIMDFMVHKDALGDVLQKFGE